MAAGMYRGRPIRKTRATGWGKEVREQPNTQRYRERFQSFADCYAEVTGQPYSLDFDRRHPPRVSRSKLLFRSEFRLAVRPPADASWARGHPRRGSVAGPANAAKARATYRDWLEGRGVPSPCTERRGRPHQKQRLSGSAGASRLSPGALHGHVHAPQFGLHPMRSSSKVARSR